MAAGCKAFAVDGVGCHDRAMHVRRATFDDIGTLRSVRLRALTDSPDAFGSTYAHELARSDDDWRRWIEPNPTFFLDAAPGEAAGIVAGVRDEQDPSIAMLMAMWVAPPSRRSGGSDLLVEAVIQWAAETESRSLYLWVTDGNEPARQLYARHGFVLTGRTLIRDRDGRTDLEMCRALR